MTEQTTNFNQKRAEKLFFKGSSNSCHETVNPEREEEFVKKVIESIDDGDHTNGRAIESC